MYFVDKEKNKVKHATIISRVDSDDIRFAGHSNPAEYSSLADTIGKYKEVRIIRLK